MEADQKASILLVDDTPRNLLALEAVLDLPGYNLVRANSGIEALKCLLDEDFAVILLDVQMPEMDGFETAARIRERDRSWRTPIIFVTALGTDEMNVSKGYALGAVDYLLKPINPDVLRAKVGFFADFFRNREMVIRQTEELARSRAEQEVLARSNTELEQSAHEEASRQREQQDNESEFFQGISRPSPAGVTAKLYGATPLCESQPEAFNEIEGRYGSLMDLALEQRQFKVDHHISDALRQVAGELGFFKAGPRDVVLIHCTALKRKTREAASAKARAYTEEGRLMILELMGDLVSFYRNHSSGARRPGVMERNDQIETESKPEEKKS